MLELSILLNINYCPLCTLQMIVIHCLVFLQQVQSHCTEKRFVQQQDLYACKCKSQYLTTTNNYNK
jgi:hypothetical protein